MRTNPHYVKSTNPPFELFVEQNLSHEDIDHIEESMRLIVKTMRRDADKIAMRKSLEELVAISGPPTDELLRHIQSCDVSVMVLVKE